MSDAQPTGGDVYVLTDANSRITSANTATSGKQRSIVLLGVSTGTASIMSMVDLYGSNPNSGSLQTTGTGFSGDVTVVNAASVTTQGSLAVGIAALSTGGAGIISGTGRSGLSYLGNKGSDYYAESGTVSLHNSGAIATTGSNAHGIVAISTGGGGLVVSQVVTTKDGETWSQGTIFGATTDGEEPSGHDGNTVTVVNSGSVTIGDAAQNGAVAMGIVAQSIGGGGGNGGNAKGLFVAVGGGGGLGGKRGDVTVTLGPQDVPGATVDPSLSGIDPVVTPSGTLGGSSAPVILTEADYAAGVIAQSVGGGHGGDSTANATADSSDIGTLTASVSLGGSGGSGGAGGALAVDSGNNWGGAGSIWRR